MDKKVMLIVEYLENVEKVSWLKQKLPNPTTQKPSRLFVFVTALFHKYFFIVDTILHTCKFTSCSFDWTWEIILLLIILYAYNFMLHCILVYGWAMIYLIIFPY